MDVSLVFGLGFRLARFGFIYHPARCEFQRNYVFIPHYTIASSIQLTPPIIQQRDAYVFTELWIVISQSFNTRIFNKNHSNHFGLYWSEKGGIFNGQYIRVHIHFRPIVVCIFFRRITIFQFFYGYLKSRLIFFYRTFY